MKKHSLYVMAITALLFSCGKADRDEDTTINETNDNNLAEIAFRDLSSIMEEAANNTSALRTADALLGCATVSYDTLSNPMNVLVDFGTTNCTGADGRMRRGRIYATFTGKYRDSLSVITITPQGYHLNDYLIEGTKTVTNKGHNSSGNLWYTVSIQNGKITEPAGSWTITYTSSRTREWIEGESTSLWNDDVYLIDGTANGTGRNGNTFSVSITEDLRIELSCAYIVSGKMTVQPANLAPRYVDFGSGSCDNEATITVNGYSFSGTMQ